MNDYKMQTYKEFMRYGDILKCEDFDFTQYGGYCITLKVAELDGRKMLFICRNGSIYSMEDLRSGEKW